MKKLAILSSIIFISSIHATDFSFEKKYDLKMPVNAQRIGGVMELREIFEANPRAINPAIKINNLSFDYSGMFKSSVKSKICMEVGKLESLNERIDNASKKVFYDKVPRVLNEAQSEVRDGLVEISNSYFKNIRHLSEFCRGEYKLDKEEIKDYVNSYLETFRNNNDRSLNYWLKKDDILAPQKADLNIEYLGASYRNEEQGGEEEKDCSFRDLFQ